MPDVDLVLGHLPARGFRDPGAVLSLAERALYRLLLGPIPKFQGILMVRRSVVERMPLTSVGRGWGVVLEMVMRAARAHARIASVATELRPRMAGRSKVRNSVTIWSNLKQAWALRKAR